MKKLKYLFIVLVAFLAMPFTVFAEETEATPTPTATEEAPSKVNVYFFRGEGCPHCQELEEFFDSIEAEFGQYYNMNTYEVWYDQDNANLMQEVADKLGVTATGVPFLVIGDQSWNGYTSSYDAEIKAKILSEYNSTSRYDVMSSAEPESNNVAAVLIVVAVIGVIGGIAYVLRASTGDKVENEEENEENRSEAKKEPVVVDSSEIEEEEKPKKSTKKTNKGKATKKEEATSAKETKTTTAKKTTKSSKKATKKTTKSTAKKTTSKRK